MKQEIKYICQNCGYEALQWMGKCPNCNEWNTLIEEKISKSAAILRPTRSGLGQPQAITDITLGKQERIKIGLDELDQVLGGGIVHGSLVLVGGEPGIGKSTLVLQAANLLAKKGLLVLYISGEESTHQIRLRAERLDAISEKLFVLPEVTLNVIEEHIRNLQPGFIIVDSIQTVYDEELSSPPGSVSQVRDCTNRFLNISKSTGTPIFIIGHVTKEGVIAGPRVLEHMVDTVLYFEGERTQQFRILRAIKNRFGSTNEVGIFEMKEDGLVEVTNPSQMFLSERPQNTPGSAVIAAVEGTRPLLVELQALVSSTNANFPRRTFTGVDFNRASIIVAALEKKTGLRLSNQDIYINAAGGIKIDEPSADLGIAMAIASSYKNCVIDGQTVFIGEVGLTGEIRGVPQIEKRVGEAAKLGFKQAVIPKGNKSAVSKITAFEVLHANHLEEVLSKFLSS
jgi:DNA repair protein RadA/Sms